MIGFLTDANNDLYIDGTNGLAMGSDLTALVQAVQNTVNTLKGEIQLDTTLGVPYFETVFNQQSPDISVWESYMIEEVEKLDGVERVNSITTRVANNTLTYEMNILTIYGGATVSG